MSGAGEGVGVLADLHPPHLLEVVLESLYPGVPGLTAQVRLCWACPGEATPLCSALFLTSRIPNAFPTFLFGMKSNILHSIFFTSAHIDKRLSTIFLGDIIFLIKVIEILNARPEQGGRHQKTCRHGWAWDISRLPLYTKSYREPRNAENRRNGPPQGRAP